MSVRKCDKVKEEGRRSGVSKWNASKEGMEEEESMEERMRKLCTKRRIES